MTVHVAALTSLTGQGLRLALSGLLSPDGPLQSRGGVVPGSGGDLTKTSGMTVRLAPVQVWVAGTAGTGQGAYILTNDGSPALDLTLDPGDATRDRIDAVVARVRDDSFDGGGVAAGSVEVIAGDYPAAGQQPSPPALPGTCQELWRVRVNAGTSTGSGGLDPGLFTDRRRYTAALGGTVPCTSGTRPATPYAGQTVYETDTGLVRVWNGATWREVYAGAEDTGWGHVTRSGEGGWATQANGAECYLRQRHGWVSLDLRIVRAGGKVTGNVVGNISPDVEILDLSGLVPLPEREWVFPFALGYYSHGTGRVRPSDGRVVLSTLAPGAEINQDDFVEVTTTYPV